MSSKDAVELRTALIAGDLIRANKTIFSLYVPTEVYEEMTGELPMRTKPSPTTPSGKEWAEDAVASLYPRLAKKHGYGG